MNREPLDVADHRQEASGPPSRAAASTTSDMSGSIP